MVPNIQTSLKTIHLESEISMARDGITTLWNCSGCMLFIFFSAENPKKREISIKLSMHGALERCATSRVMHLN